MLSTLVTFATPDPCRNIIKNAFELQRNDIKSWEPLLKVARYNKFAASANDLNGKWTSDLNGATSYYNVYSAVYMGTKSYTSVRTSTFRTNQTYNWNLVVARGSAGGMNVENGGSNGRYTVAGYWNMEFSNIDGRPVNYDVRFSCNKGGRSLWIDGKASALAK